MLNRVRRWLQGASQETESSFPYAFRFEKQTLDASEQRRRDMSQRLRLAQLSERLKTLNLIHAELIRATSVAELCRMAVEYGRARLGLSRLSIWLLKPDNLPQLHGTYGIDEYGNIRDERHKRSPIREPYEPSLMAQLDLSTKDQLEFNFQVEQDVILVNDSREPIGKGWLAGCRILSADGVIGWMFVDNLLSQSPYTEDDGDIIRLYAHSIGHLLDNKRMEEGLRQQQTAEQALQMQMRTLNQLSIELTRSTTFDDLTRNAVEMGRARLGFDRLSLWFLEPDGVVALGSFGTDEQGNTRDERMIRIHIGPQDLAWQAREQGKLVMVSHQASLMDHQRQLVGNGWNAAALLWDGDRIIGWIATDNLINHRPFTTSDQEVLTLYGVTVGHLCTRKRVEERLLQQRAEERQFQERLRALTEINLELTRIEKFDDLTRRAVELGRERLGFDRLAIFFIQDDRIHAMGSYGTDEAGHTRDERTVQINVRDNHLAFRAGAGEELVEVLEGKLVNHRGETVGQGWNAAALLWDGKKAIGWLAADNLLNQRPLSQSDRDTLALFGTSLGHLVNRKYAEAAALEMAVQKERAELMTEFISNLSHDLRTPLSIINTSLYLIERLDDPAQQREKVANIQSQTARLEKLIQDILTMSRLENQMTHTLHPVQVNHLLSDLTRLYQPVVERKNQSLTLETDQDTSTVMGLEDEMMRVFSNLLDNAINYTPVGGAIRLRVRQEGLWVYAEVSDTGVGIQPEDLPRIFDRFYRADSARSGVSGGAGLGLSIVKRLVDILGAEISVESSPGKGTTFRLKFVALRGRPAAASKPGVAV
jgi:signal transduction histidine kinase